MLLWLCVAITGDKFLSWKYLFIGGGKMCIKTYSAGKKIPHSGKLDFCQAQFQSSPSPVQLEMRLALILFITTPTHPHPPGKVEIQLENENAYSPKNLSLFAFNIEGYWDLIKKKLKEMKSQMFLSMSLHLWKCFVRLQGVQKICQIIVFFSSQ